MMGRKAVVDRRHYVPSMLDLSGTKTTDKNVPGPLPDFVQLNIDVTPLFDLKSSCSASPVVKTPRLFTKGVKFVVLVTSGAAVMMRLAKSESPLESSPRTAPKAICVLMVFL